MMTYDKKDVILHPKRGTYEKDIDYQYKSTKRWQFRYAGTRI